MRVRSRRKAPALLLAALALGLLAGALWQMIAPPGAWRVEAERQLAAGNDAGAAAALARGVAVSPGDAYAWARLAAVRLRLGERAAAAHALQASLARGPFERPLTVDRLPLLATLGTPADTVAALRRAWVWDYRRTLHLLPPQRYWPLYRRALDGDALALAAAHAGLR